jgi:hypothetical protein
MRKFAFCSLLAVSALAQNPAFDVASVKINRQQPFVDSALRVSGDSLNHAQPEPESHRRLGL